MNELTPETVATTFLMLPWRLYNHQTLDYMIVKNADTLETFAQKAQQVLNEEMTLRQQTGESVEPSTFGTVLLSERIFSFKVEHRDDSLRAAFEACLAPDYRKQLMAQGISNYVWVQTRVQYDVAATDHGDPVAEAMVNMLDTLKQEISTLRMDMLDDAPALLWEDLLAAVNAPQGRKANALLERFMEEGYAAQLAGGAYLLLDSLIWTLPQMVVELSRKPKKKKHLVDAGYKIFSAMLRSRPDATDSVLNTIRAEVEEGGMDRIRDAMTAGHQAFGLGEEESALQFTVSEDRVGHVRVEQLSRVKH